MPYLFAANDLRAPRPVAGRQLCEAELPSGVQNSRQRRRRESPLCRAQSVAQSGAITLYTMWWTIFHHNLSEELAGGSTAFQALVKRLQSSLSCQAQELTGSLAIAGFQLNSIINRELTGSVKSIDAARARRPWQLLLGRSACSVPAQRPTTGRAPRTSRLCRR